MTTRKVILGAALIVVGLPILLICAGMAGLYALLYFPNRTTARSESMVSSGENREYLLYVPKSYNAAKPTPLVISLHPAMSWPSSEMHISQWNRVADQNGFIVVYPAGLGTGPKTWFMNGSKAPAQMPDVVFISQLIDLLEARYHIDSTRIYADGMSNGGGMAFALSCTLSHRIAAIGAVSAAQSLTWKWCTDTTPVPMIAFHGTADPVVPFQGAGVGAINPRPFPNEALWVGNWARRNRCALPAVESRVAADVKRLAYGHCANNADVVLYSILGGGHQWPGGPPLAKWVVGPSTQSIDATRLMWAFFRAHPLVRR